jgi:hypothetical protein
MAGLAIRSSPLSLHFPAMALTHQKLIVYQKALDVMVEVLRLTRSAKPGWGALVNQLKRAATSRMSRRV